MADEEKEISEPYTKQKAVDVPLQHHFDRNFSSSHAYQYFLSFGKFVLKISVVLKFGS